MRTWLQSQSSSSATIIGSEVLMPCPISGFFDMIVTVPSGAMETKAESCAGPAPSFSAAARVLGSGISTSSASPPPARSDALSMVRRSRPARSGSRNTAALLFHAGGDPDRAADTVVATAATDVARHGCIDLSIVRLRGPPEECARRHDLTGLAVTALHHVDLEPRLLQPLADRGRADVLDGVDFRRSDAAHGELAGALRGAIHVDGAGTAKPRAASVLGAHQPELTAQHPQQWHLGRDIHLPNGAIDVESIPHDRTRTRDPRRSRI